MQQRWATEGSASAGGTTTPARARSVWARSSNLPSLSASAQASQKSWRPPFVILLVAYPRQYGPGSVPGVIDDVGSKRGRTGPHRVSPSRLGWT